MNQRSLLLVPCLALGLLGCSATVGVSGRTVPPDARNQCQEHCAHIGMDLGAVAIMANNVGCVCQLSGATGGGASITAGMATIAMQEAEQQRQQQQRSAAR